MSFEPATRTMAGPCCWQSPRQMVSANIVHKLIQKVKITGVLMMENDVTQQCNVEKKIHIMT